MHSSLKNFIFCAVSLVLIATTVQAQKSVDPPPAGSSATDVQKWLAESLPKYASFRTKSASVTISEVSLDGCVLKFTRSKKTGVTTSVTEGAKRVVSSEKENVTIDLRSVDAEKITVNDYLYEDLQLLEIKFSPDEPEVELIVKRSAVKAIRLTLAMAGDLCKR